MRSILAFVFGFVLLGIGIGYGFNTTYLAVFGKTTTGVVIGWTKDHPSPDRFLQRRSYRYKYPQVRFTAPNGQVITFTDNHGDMSPPAKGAKVTVRYNPSRPGHAEIVSGIEPYFIPIACIIGGIFVVFQPLLPGIRRN